MKLLKTISILLAMLLAFTTISMAEDTAEEIDNDANEALIVFYKEVNGGKKFLDNAKGYVVFPDVKEAGFFVGGKYGEGALRVNGVTKHFYSMTAASIGYQVGVQEHSVLIAFVSEASLNNFIKSNGWEAGVDGSITVADWGKNKDITSISYEKPIIGFIYGEQGLMAGVSIEGTKFKKIIP